MDMLPLWLILLLTTALVFLSLEAGFRLGAAALRDARHEQEGPVTATVGSVLGLTAFVLAFTFGIVYQRYDEKKNLVREEATALWTAYQRTDFLPAPDAVAAKQALRRYTGLHAGLPAAIVRDNNRSAGNVARVLAEAEAIEQRLWQAAVTASRNPRNSDAMASYAEALNAVAVLEETRIAALLETRVHASIWATLLLLTFCGMLALGYQTGISGSRRSRLGPVMAGAFGILLTLIAALDRPVAIGVSQQPLLDVLARMEADALQ